MKSISSAPGKVILFGEHFIVYGGKAILCSIDKRITVESELTGTGRIEIKSSLGEISVPKDAKPSEVGSALRPIAHIVQRMLSERGSESGVRVSVTAEFPSGVGLGSSSACCVAAASSIMGLFGEHTKEQALRLAIDAERTIFEDTSGADCNVCTYGGIIEYHRHGMTERLAFEPKFTLIVANSKTSHSTSDVVSKVKKYKDLNPAIFSLLCSQEERLIDDAMSALRENDLGSVGARMSQNQKYLEQIGVSNERLNSMLETVRGISYGAKITGAGDGGCIIAMTDESNLNATMNALAEKNYECFATKIDTAGLQHKVTE